LEAVEPYLFNIFNDPDIIDIPFPGFIRKRFARWLAKKRSPESREIYSKIGGKTPLTEITNHQAGLLENALNQEDDHQYKVFPAMRYWHPFVEDVWQEINQSDFTDIVILSLYPFYSTTTAGSLEKLLDRLLMTSRFDKENIRIISRFGNYPGFIDAIVLQIKRIIIEESNIQYNHLLLSPHSIPVKRIKNGDPYKVEIEEAYNLIRAGLPEIEVHLAYQSKIGPVKWLSPSTPDKITELAQKGVKDLLVYPLGFVADNSETIYEIGMLYKELANKMGIRNFKRIDALNTDEIFIRAMKEIILNKAKG
ncbi:MAG: ferrochelatase, partial [Calditrichaceae bacterium]|nr:ferrochelatase [Calditrichaceae bacterium]